MSQGARRVAHGRSEGRVEPVAVPAQVWENGAPVPDDGRIVAGARTAAAVTGGRAGLDDARKVVTASRRTETNRCLKKAKPPGSGPAAQRRNRPSTRLVAYRGYLLTRGAVGLCPDVPRNQWPTRTGVNGGIDRRVVRRTVRPTDEQLRMVKGGE
jgi:hypothetical protein